MSSFPFFYIISSDRTENFTQVSMTGRINGFEFKTEIFNTSVIFQGTAAYKPRLTGKKSLIIYGNEKLQKCVSGSAGLLERIVQDYIYNLPKSAKIFEK